MQGFVIKDLLYLHILNNKSFQYFLKLIIDKKRAYSKRF